MANERAAMIGHLCTNKLQGDGRDLAVAHSAVGCRDVQGCPTHCPPHRGGRLKIPVTPCPTLRMWGALWRI